MGFPNPLPNFQTCRLEENGAPERIRTPDPQIRSLVLYPAELPVRGFERQNLVRATSDGKHGEVLTF
jgi:hypothetical protein